MFFYCEIIMESCYFLSGTGTVSCGKSRGTCNIIKMKECQEDIRGHLASCHLSRSNTKEYELILARAGLFGCQQNLGHGPCATHGPPYGLPYGLPII